jgi:hypothetical protein
MRSFQVPLAQPVRFGGRPSVSRTPRSVNTMRSLAE